MNAIVFVVAYRVALLQYDDGSSDSRRLKAIGLLLCTCAKWLRRYRNSSWFQYAATSRLWLTNTKKKTTLSHATRFADGQKANPLKSINHCNSRTAGCCCRRWLQFCCSFSLARTASIFPRSNEIIKCGWMRYGTGAKHNDPNKLSLMNKQSICLPVIAFYFQWNWQYYLNKTLWLWSLRHKLAVRTLRNLIEPRSLE